MLRPSTGRTAASGNRRQRTAHPDRQNRQTDILHASCLSPASASNLATHPVLRRHLALPFYWAPCYRLPIICNPHPEPETPPLPPPPPLALQIAGLSSSVIRHPCPPLRLGPALDRPSTWCDILLPGFCRSAFFQGIDPGACTFWTLFSALSNAALTLPAVTPAYAARRRRHRTAAPSTTKAISNSDILASAYIPHLGHHSCAFVSFQVLVPHTPPGPLRSPTVRGAAQTKAQETRLCSGFPAQTLNLFLSRLSCI